jgi:hypothetical protein
MKPVHIPTMLFTRTGKLVTEVLVPPFQLPAEIIVWGERFFVRTPQGEYREGMPWFAYDVPGVGACTRPPPGWSCSRGAGHEGPCAASPTSQ